MTMKVKAIKYFKDAKVNKDRNIGDIFEVDEERAKVLVEHNAVEVLSVEVEELEESDIKDEGILSEEEVKELKDNEVIEVVVKPKKSNKKRSK